MTRSSLLALFAMATFLASCDSQSISDHAEFAVSIGKEIRLLSLDGESIRTFGVEGIGPAWHPDGESVLYWSQDGLIRHRLSSWGPSVLADESDHLSGRLFVGVNGAVVVRASPPGIFGDFRIRLYEPPEFGRETLTDSNAPPYWQPVVDVSRGKIYARVLPDSTASGFSVAAIPLNGGSATPLPGAQTGSGLALDLSRSEDLLAFSDSDAIYIYDLRLEQLVDSVALPHPSYIIWSVSFSPHDDALAVAANTILDGSSATRDYELYILDLSSHDYRKILSAEQQIEVSWRPR